MEYFNPSTDDITSVKNKKKVFVKCYCSVCNRQMADRTLYQYVRSTFPLKCKSCVLKEKSKNALEKRKKTCLERYGCENVFQRNDVVAVIKEKNSANKNNISKKISESHHNRTKEDVELSNQKRKKTCLERYGQENINQLDSVKRKTKETCLEKYGKTSYLATDECKKAFKEKFGVDNISQTEMWREKCKTTSKEKYGVEWPTQSKKIIEKIQKTNFEKYGFKYYINTPTYKKSLYAKWTEDALKRYNLQRFNLEYIGNLTVRCIKCGYEKHIKHSQADISPNLCPNCRTKYRSSYENIINDYLGCETILNTRDIIKPKELDIFVPEKKVAFEIDGLYFHQNKEKDYHLQKTLSCDKLGIRLLHITDKMIIEKPNIVRSIVRQSIGKVDRKIFARKCVVREVSQTDYKTFCNENHIQGYVAAKIKIGLFFEDELVQLMSFSKPRFNKQYEWELLRECSKLDTQILGGASKLFSYFKKIYNPKSVISYCDKSLFTGQSYLKIGMELLKETPPSYIYYKDGVVLTRYQCQKHKLSSLLDHFDSQLSEKENMIANGYGIIYDCGEKVFLWQQK